MAKPIRAYNVDETVVSLGGYHVNGGWSADSAVVVEFSDPEQIKKVVGLSGDVVISRSRNKTGTATFSLLQGCDADKYLVELYNSQSTAAGGIANTFPFQLRDLNGTLQLRSTFSWVESVPSFEFKGEATAREWKIGLAEIEIKG